MVNLYPVKIVGGKYRYLLFSTTSRESANIIRLPDKEFNGEFAANFLITDDSIAHEFFEQIDGDVEIVLIDVERKQGNDLMEVAKEVLKKTQILPYKPNDVTLEAADQLILNQLGVDLSRNKILVYGTGNISFKLALRLLEREADVSIVGRNQEKVESIASTLNMIKPRHSNAVARAHCSKAINEYDGLVSFVSSEKVIEPIMTIHIKSGGFAIDGGIGNFTGQFITEALKKEITVLRLDVRLGNPFLIASINALSPENEFFTSVIGSKSFSDVKLVAGGIIGEDGSIIVDRINNPTQIIGVANGYGGLKNEEQLTEMDKNNLQNVANKFL